MNSKPRILVVDDELNIRRILQMAFDKVGYQTLVAEDAREAGHHKIGRQILAAHRKGLSRAGRTRTGGEGSNKCSSRRASRYCRIDCRSRNTYRIQEVSSPISQW